MHGSRARVLVTKLRFSIRNVTMSTETSQFKKEDHAAIYLKNRPEWPPEIIQRSLSFLREKNPEPFKLAVDVGCGSGQNTRPLTPYFEKIIGVDVSEAQIRAAQSLKNPPNVEFRIGSAESIAVPDRSVDLITCAESVHWFDLDAFFREMDRILKPSGCIAIYTYHKIRPWVEGDDVKNEQLRDMIMQLCSVTLGPYNSPGARHLFNRLADIRIPYDETVRNESFHIQYDTTVASYLDYIRSWAIYQAYLEKNPSGPDILKEVQKRFRLSSRRCQDTHKDSSCLASWKKTTYMYRDLFVGGEQHCLKKVF
ncbi:putative methyltransferase DDB_G0268948 isoform X2 [Acanthaster planci]|uniref:Methyltransferase DDB_G0268948 isoform X2 n=1 Tax=Acanthaster planci TaxID=133434 RepID=A0A8B7YXT4_ACAPL|nr:putative methyltransferase DDB_G0268948 isoform X2 [Acanthaster planci]